MPRSDPEPPVATLSRSRSLAPKVPVYGHWWRDQRRRPRGAVVSDHYPPSVRQIAPVFELAWVICGHLVTCLLCVWWREQRRRPRGAVVSGQGPLSVRQIAPVFELAWVTCGHLAEWRCLPGLT